MEMEKSLALVKKDKGFAALAAVEERSGVLSVANLETVERTLLVALAVQDLRKTLTDEIMQRCVMPFMNTQIGFDTDRNPAKGWRGESYPLATVRECFIEATLHGLPLLGNHWNIIAERIYVRKEGYEHLLRQRVDFTSEARLNTADVMRVAKEAGGGYVKAVTVVRWRPHGSEDEAKPFSGTYNVKVNFKGSVEATEGKALRKGYRDLWKSLTGMALQDGEVGDVLEVTAVSESRGGPVDASPVPPPEKAASLDEATRNALEKAIKKAGKMDEALGRFGTPDEWTDADVLDLRKMASA